MDKLIAMDCRINHWPRRRVRSNRSDITASTMFGQQKVLQAARPLR